MQQLTTEKLEAFAKSVTEQRFLHVVDRQSQGYDPFSDSDREVDELSCTIDEILTARRDNRAASRLEATRTQMLDRTAYIAGAEQASLQNARHLRRRRESAVRAEHYGLNGASGRVTTGSLALGLRTSAPATAKERPINFKIGVNIGLK